MATTSASLRQRKGGDAAAAPSEKSKDAEKKEEKKDGGATSTPAAKAPSLLQASIISSISQQAAKMPKGNQMKAKAKKGKEKDKDMASTEPDASSSKPASFVLPVQQFVSTMSIVRIASSMTKQLYGVPPDEHGSSTFQVVLRTYTPSHDDAIANAVLVWLVLSLLMMSWGQVALPVNISLDRSFMIPPHRATFGTLALLVYLVSFLLLDMTGGLVTLPFLYALYAASVHLSTTIRQRHVGILWIVASVMIGLLYFVSSTTSASGEEGGAMKTEEGEEGDGDGFGQALTVGPLCSLFQALWAMGFHPEL